MAEKQRNERRTSVTVMLNPGRELDDRITELAAQAPPFWKNSNLFKLYLLMIPGCLFPAITLGFDAAMMNGLQAVPRWDQYFDKPRGALLGIMSAILPLGCCIASPFVPLVGDRWGRRAGIFFGAAVMLCGGIIQGTSVNFAMFLVSRFIIGCGLVFANAYAPMLIGELAHAKQRQVITSLYQTSWYIGAILAAWTTFGTFSMHSDASWRIPSYLQAAPAIIPMGFIFFLPESPRWLIANGRADEAKAMLVKWHGNGDENDEYVKLEFQQMRNVIEAEVNSSAGWKTLFATPGNRRRVLILVCLGCFSQWSGNGLVSYYLVRVLETVGVTNARDRNILNGCLMIFNWITSVVSAFLTARLKRRTQFLVSVFGMLAVFATQTLCAGLFNVNKDHQAGQAVIAMLFLFYIFYNLAFNALLYSYPVEILPYPIRAKGFSLLMFFGKASNFINIMVNPIGLKALEWKFYFVYVAWLSIECLIIYFFFVETKGPSLEAIAAVFDGETNGTPDSADEIERGDDLNEKKQWNAVHKE
ncbi:general substrate transporter [Bipolaris maydis]|nr:general substrate transporter [Bipolaris maydis]KAJ6192452.1 general substrate transporter [Bipolaris maydis]KAJ6215198.1 general substrate transporter [Bipolaris maydis]